VCRQLPLAPARPLNDSLMSACFQGLCLQDWLLLLVMGTVATVAVLLRPRQSLGQQSLHVTLEHYISTKFRCAVSTHMCRAALGLEWGAWVLLGPGTALEL
jgi:hypothetical protein